MRLLENWTVQYRLPEGTTPAVPVQVPHAWGSEVDLRWEGPAIYRSSVRLPKDAWLVFEGVSYEAAVSIDNVPAGYHRGMWDAFAIDVRQWSGQDVEVSVEVVKNGGLKFPVRHVLSGFLPYVFGTFGGIYKPVRTVSSDAEPVLFQDAATDRARVVGAQVFLDNKPFFTKGVLSWGWYPDIRHANPSPDVISREVALARQMGFNVIKFCLWMPPHGYLEEMHRQGLMAWIELPLWDPDGDLDRLAEIKDELRRIILQYRHHPNVLFWTCGCELSKSVSADFRREVYELVVKLTGNPLVKDNSGGSEMYGADPVEFGGFYDYHPYCDLPYYPLVIESLRNGPRTPKPILFGEFNDFDTHRDLSRVATEQPCWACDDPAQNCQGVRWQMDLPGVVRESPWAAKEQDVASAELRALSWARAIFVRNQVFDWVAMCDDIAGTVLTGWVDTPISTSGVLDDSFQPKGIADVREWTEDPRAFLIPRRSPPWLDGGNRPGLFDSNCVWTDEGFWRVGVRGELPEATVFWRLVSESDEILGSGKLEDQIGGHQPRELGVISINGLPPGQHRLELGVGGHRSRTVWAIPRAETDEFAAWGADQESRKWSQLSEGKGNLIVAELNTMALNHWRQGHDVLCIIDRGPTISRPFWRECALWTTGEGWAADFVAHPALQYGLSTEAALHIKEVEELIGSPGRVEVLRVDTRAYEESAYSMVFRERGAVLRVTTLRPFGGMGAIPFGLHRNPAGVWALRHWLAAGLEHAGPFD